MSLDPAAIAFGIGLIILLISLAAWGVSEMLKPDPNETQRREFRRFCQACGQITGWIESTTKNGEREVTVSLVCQKCKTGQSWVELRQ